MKLDSKTLPLALRLEAIIGNSCHNPNSYDGRTGEWGRSYRYALTYPVKVEGGILLDKSKYDFIIKQHITPSNFKQAFYKFGSNELGIGSAILEILDELEQRYGLDFKQLEKERKSKKD